MEIVVGVAWKWGHLIVFAELAEANRALSVGLVVVWIVSGLDESVKHSVLLGSLFAVCGAVLPNLLCDTREAADANAEYD